MNIDDLREEIDAELDEEEYDEAKEVLKVERRKTRSKIQRVMSFIQTVKCFFGQHRKVRVPYMECIFCSHCNRMWRDI